MKFIKNSGNLKGLITPYGIKHKKLSILFPTFFLCKPYQPFLQIFHLPFLFFMCFYCICFYILYNLCIYIIFIFYTLVFISFSDNKFVKLDDKSETRLLYKTNFSSDKFE